MDYLSTARIATYTAFIVSGLLLGLLSFQSIRHPWKRTLIPGVIGQVVWISALFISYVIEINPIALLYTELLRYALWLVSLGWLLSMQTKWPAWPRKLRFLSVVAVLALLFATYLLASQAPWVNWLRFSLVVLASLCLIFTEQALRNLNAHRLLKLIGLCLAFVFGFDLLMYGQSMVANEISSGFIQGRAALALVTGAAIIVGLLVLKERRPNGALFSVSRHAAFFSTTAVLSGLIIGVMVLGNLVFSGRTYFSNYLFSLLFLGLSLLLITLMVSQTFRQHVEVFLSKHFFTLKYDYRAEWLNAISQLSELRSEQADYHPRILNLMVSAARARSGSLWLRQGADLVPVCGHKSLKEAPESIAINAPFVRTMLKEQWIYVPNTRDAKMSRHNELLPTWLAQGESVWLIVPLIIQMKLVGIATVAKPTADDSITFEDRDLMTNLSTQVASHILLHQQERVISDAKQLETFNRLSAFLMHDMNNITAQLALLTKNAARHKDNPAFIDDMIKTVANATSRMQDLAQRFNPNSKENRTAFRVSELFAEVKESVQDKFPVPELLIDQDFIVEADRQKLNLALKNLVRNAQEASGSEGHIAIKAHASEKGRHITVEDNGTGMSREFISEELFRPFATTKDQNGLGIGAYLTKSYIEHLGALLSVDSKQGEGTKFQITFG